MKILCRYILAVAGFFGIVNVHFCRINLSIAIVDMIDDQSSSSNGSKTYECPVWNNATSVAETEGGGEFAWNRNQRGLLLGSYFYGYTAMQIPGAWVASKYGFKRSFGYSMLLAAVLTCVFPELVRLNVYLGVVARIILGVFHAVAFPAMTGAWGAWAPPLEVTQLNGIAFSGASAGTCIIFYLAASVTTAWGWEAVFYLTGGLSLLWVLVWFLVVYDTPDLHPRISTEEKEYIKKHVGITGHSSKNRIPWKGILSSLPVWGIIIGHTASNWGNYTLNQQLPTYLSSILRFDLELTGLLSSLCYVLQWLVCVLASWLTDKIRTKNLISTIWIRKINTAIGLWVTGVCVVLAGYAGCNVYISITLFLLAAGINTFTVPGCKSSQLDIAPAFSGIVFGVSNTVANIPGFLAPSVVGFIVKESTIQEWIIVFWISAAVHIVGSVLFLFKGSDQVQDWAIPEQPPANDLGLEEKKPELCGSSNPVFENE